MKVSDPIEVMLDVVKVLDNLGIYYYLGGSLASSAYGIPRSTQDVDIIADIHEYHIDSLIQLFSDEFYIDDEMIREAITSKSSFNIIHLDSMTKVDIFIFKDTPFTHSEMSRRRRELIRSEPESFVYISSPEGIILQKLSWYNLGGRVSDRQWQDILGVIKVQSTNLDLKYLNSWARNLNLSELLAQAFEEAGKEF